MHRPLCCYGRSALAALLFPVAEIAGVSDLGGVELAVLVLGGDGGAGLHGVQRVIPFDSKNAIVLRHDGIFYRS